MKIVAVSGWSNSMWVGWIRESQCHRNKRRYHDTPMLGHTGEYFVNAGPRRKVAGSGQSPEMSMFFRSFRQALVRRATMDLEYPYRRRRARLFDAPQ
jgi:hypothetical protein